MTNKQLDWKKEGGCVNCPPPPYYDGSIGRYCEVCQKLKNKKEMSKKKELSKSEDTAKVLETSVSPTKDENNIKYQDDPTLYLWKRAGGCANCPLYYDASISNYCRLCHIMNQKREMSKKMDVRKKEAAVTVLETLVGTKKDEKKIKYQETTAFLLNECANCDLYYDGSIAKMCDMCRLMGKRGVSKKKEVSKMEGFVRIVKTVPDTKKDANEVNHQDAPANHAWK